MKQLFIAFKRHVFFQVMTFLCFLTPAFFPLQLLHAENPALQQLFDSAESETNLEQLFQLIENLKNNPVSLNVADVDELRQLPWLTSFDAHTILSHTGKGPVLSLQEKALVAKRPARRGPKARASALYYFLLLSFLILLLQNLS